MTPTFLILAEGKMRSFPTHTGWWVIFALREESSQTNVILQYKLLAPILSPVCSVIQQS